MKKISYALMLLLFFATVAFSQNSALNGKWKLINAKSSFLDYYREMTLEFSVGKSETSIITKMGPKRRYEEKLVLKTDGKANSIEIADGTFADNIHMGLRLPLGKKKEVKAVWEKDNSLNVNEKYDLFASQGVKKSEVTYSFELSPYKDLLTMKVKRTSRKKGPETKYVFKRFDDNNAYVMKMDDDWSINGKLPEQACLISIQGIVNEKNPNLYFVYGPKWPFNYTEDLYSYLENGRNFSFTKLNSLEEALNTFKDQIKGYIVWDKKVSISLIVAYTLAGLEKGIVITEDLIPLAQKIGLKPIDDFRGRFVGKSDYEIYSWAKEKYWSRCSRETIVWLGGEFGTVLKPGIADYGMLKKAFFSDLSGRATDTLEYKLTKELLGDMKPLSHVVGWHSYKKDLEEEWCSLTSSYALTIDGLNTLPNMSFLYNVPASPGFKFTNRHNVVPGKTYTPEKKTYIALVQTDGLGLGAWVKPGRGSIPYAWEVSMKFQYIAPAMMEYFYTQATPNDYFIGCLSGSAYMYPKAFPKKWLPKEIDKAYDLMKKLDLNVFEIMDYSEGGNETCDNNLPKDIVDEYYKGMPDAIGFLNGYRASNTFTIRDKKPFVSYDYYLAAEKPENEVVADLEELAEINADRPYFLLVHVRENSDVVRVKSICDKLGNGIEIVPLDVFLKMAGENPTYKENYYQKR
jgi:hypothetical protein